MKIQRKPNAKKIDTVKQKKGTQNEKGAEITISDLIKASYNDTNLYIVRLPNKTPSICLWNTIIQS